jgi:hypothetical protein
MCNNANYRAPLDAAIPLCLYIGRRGRAASEHGRWPETAGGRV